MTTYYFTTFDFQLAYEVLNIQPNHVYKTDDYKYIKNHSRAPDFLLNDQIVNADSFNFDYNENETNIKINTDRK